MRVPSESRLSINKEFFLPPQFNLAFAWTCDALLPNLLKQYQNIDNVVIKPEDRDMLRSLRDRRLIYFSNHPSQAEPMIAYHVANVIGSRFRYMATRRAFDFAFGVLGRVFQAVGAFSIIPGIADREAMRMARSILCEQGGKLVLYPEGEPMCGENDSLMPFQPGILKLGFGALEDLRKQDSAGDITLLPGFIKYVITESRAMIHSNLEYHIGRLERELGANPGRRNLLRRFLMVGRMLLEQQEKYYNLIPDPGDAAHPMEDFNYRVGHLRHHILDNVAQKIGAAGYNQKADAIQKLRHLTAVLEMVEIGYPHPKLPKLNDDELKWANAECVKAYDFIVIKTDYLISNPTPERFYEWVARFESLLLGKTPRALGGEPSPLPRNAVLSFAQPFGLSEYLDAYRANKSDTLNSLMARLASDMGGLLDEAQALSRPIVEPGDVGEP